MKSQIQITLDAEHCKLYKGALQAKNIKSLSKDLERCQNSEKHQLSSKLIDWLLILTFFANFEVSMCEN